MSIIQLLNFLLSSLLNFFGEKIRYNRKKDAKEHIFFSQVLNLTVIIFIIWLNNLNMLYQLYFLMTGWIFWFNSQKETTTTRNIARRLFLQSSPFFSSEIMIWFYTFSWMEATSYLSLVLWNGRRIFSIWRTDMCYEVWQLDLWRIPGIQW